MPRRQDVGNGVRAEVVKLPGRSSPDYAAKCWVGGRHIATVSEPDRCSPSQALDAARRWARRWKKRLTRSAS